MQQKIKLLSFDLDDTLWPCLPTILNAEKQLYQWLQKHVPQIPRRYSSEQLREKRLSCLKKYPEYAHDLSALRLLSFQQLAEELLLDDAWIETAFDIFYKARQQVTLFSDVTPVLDSLSQDYQLASLTNGNASVAETGIDHWFDFSLNSAAIGQLKSEPDIYWQLQKMAGINAGQMMHIGDHPQQDVLGAQSAGVFAVWLNRENQPWCLQGQQPDAEINSLQELIVLLDTLQIKK